jgi:hypothetical protein
LVILSPRGLRLALDDTNLTLNCETVDEANEELKQIYNSLK